MNFDIVVASNLIRLAEVLVMGRLRQTELLLVYLSSVLMLLISKYFLEIHTLKHIFNFLSYFIFQPACLWWYCDLFAVLIINEVYIRIMLVPKMHALLFCTILLFSYTFFFPQQLLCLSPSTITHHSTNYDPVHISVTLGFIHLWLHLSDDIN